MNKMENSFSSAGQVGEIFFKYRDFTALPLIFLLFLVANPTVFSVSLGIVFIVTGEFLRIYSVSYIGAKSRTRGHGTGSELIQDGPYALTRNPLYLANFLICMGFAFFSGQLWFLLVTAILFYVQYSYIIQFEEEVLQAKFSEAYEAYCDRVPRLFPHGIPNLEKLKMPEDFFLSLKTEKRTLWAISFIWMILMVLD